MSYFQTPGVAIVTGSAGGIGQGCANALALAGARAIVFADIDLARAQTAAADSKRHATHPSYQPLALHLDVTDPESVEDLVKQTLQHFDRIDYLVNSAGVDTASYAKTPDLDIADYDRVLAINTKGMLLVSQAVIRVMQTQSPLTFTLPSTGGGGTREIGRGSIVQHHFGVGLHRLPREGRVYPTDVAPKGIRINALCPSWVRTPMWAAEWAKQPGTADFAAAACPPGRIAEVDEVGNAAVFLLSPAGGYVSGVGVLVDYGLSLGG